MKYAIKLDDDRLYFSQHKCEIGNIRDFFGDCLECMLQEHECQMGLPTGSNPWFFIKGNSKKEMIGGVFETIETFCGTMNKEELWKLYEWCRQAVSGFRVVADY